MRQWIGSALALAACVTSVAGCSTSVAGQPAQTADVTATSGETPTTTRSPRTPTSSSTPGSDGPLADVSPCDLLTETDRAQLGLKSAPKEQTITYSRVCQFSETEARFVTSVAIVALGPDQNVAGATDRRQIPAVGRHEAQQWMFGGTCVVSLTVSESSTVSTSGGARGDDKRSCEIAIAMARVVEPKLP